MISDHSVNQYSPASEESYDQPLDFSKSSRVPSQPLVTSIHVKQEVHINRNRGSSGGPKRRHSETDDEDDTAGAHQSVANCFTTPSPSPPEHNPNASSHHSTQVLCQLLQGSLIPTSTGKLVPNTSANNKSGLNALALQHQLLTASHSQRYNGGQSQTSPLLSPSPPPAPQRASTQSSSAAMMRALNDRHNNSSRSPSGSESPIGLGPLNQMEMHFSSHHSPTTPSGVDRFGTSGGLLTTASNAASLYANNDSAKRHMKYNRPFKAYPRDPLSVSMNPVMGFYGGLPLTADTIATQSLLATASDQAYLQFREQMLVSRKGQQESQLQQQQQYSQDNSRRSSSSNGQHPSSLSKTNSTHMNTSATSMVSPDQRLSTKTNGNNNGTHSPTDKKLKPINGTPISATSAATPIPTSTPLITTTSSASIMTPMAHHMSSADDTSQNGHSSGNSSSGEADMGSSGGSANRKRGRPLPEDLKDDAYWERRRKNNEAAKRSRDARRAKEDEIAIRAAFLEQENLKLRCEIAQLKTETTRLRCLMAVNPDPPYSLNV
ncbi:unnamed protein product [Oppiella nova]|uniref:BZIP domain-containing protein n=1 Tax=Oppiella nova TaxID=334625 RepID=A0A7R9QIX8_9ACAR|nr:unnamed protein product [Oppiella nova]CAG2166273.1 unnamed protein product [Oppiella nova]